MWRWWRRWGWGWCRHCEKRGGGEGVCPVVCGVWIVVVVVMVLPDDVWCVSRQRVLKIFGAFSSMIKQARFKVPYYFYAQKREYCCLATRTGGRLSLRGRGLPWHLCCIEKKGGKWNPIGTRKIQKRLTHKSIHVKHGRCLVCSHHLSWKWCVVGVVFRLLKSSF